MKVTTEYRSKSRVSIDKRVAKIKALEFLFDVPSGWIRAVRESLGLSSQMLESRLGIARGSVSKIELREREKTVTLATLDSLARGMDCKLVYALVPLGDNDSLEAIIKSRAEKLASSILGEVVHSMKLEAQEVNPDLSRSDKEQLVRGLIEKLDRRLWEAEQK